MSESPTDDGLAIPSVGLWSRRKYHFLARYLDAFTTAMREKWSELHYVDLFAGAGLARLKNGGELVYASPLIAARLKYPFTQLHLCDSDQANVTALRSRLRSFAMLKPPQILHGDANELHPKLLAQVPSRGALCMTFADPFGLHLDFQTISAVATRQSDLIVLIADNMDALRNWATYYYDNPQSNLDRFMGQPGWRDMLRATSPERAAVKLRGAYQQQLRGLGYAHFREVKVQNSQDRDIYTLLYASKSRVGAQIWDGIASKDESGQMGLQFGQ